MTFTIMINWVLRVLAVMVALLIVLVVFLRRTSIGIGVRTTQNIFANELANIAVSTWLLLILLLIEVILLILFSSRRSL